MASRTLRSRTAEASREDRELPAGESVISTPSEENVGLGSESDNNKEVDRLIKCQSNPRTVNKALRDPQ
jgi:hypothetical protein